MSPPAGQNPILVGIGGPYPGVELVSFPGPIIRLMNFPAWHSIYAIATSPHNGLVAAGSMGGLLVVFPDGSDDSANPKVDKQNLLQGSGIVSLCWMDHGRLASSDDYKRVLWWDLDTPHQPKSLSTAGTIICGLTQLDFGRLGGLGIDGRLFIWRPPASEPEEIHELIPPPPEGALVRINYCPMDQTVIFPGVGGKLVRFDLGRREAQIWLAHEGDCYAVIQNGSVTFTIGISDGLLKAWQEGAITPTSTFTAPRGVIGGALYTVDPVQLLLISRQGQATIHLLKDDGLQLVGALPLEDCLTASCCGTPGQEALSSQKDIESIVTRITEAFQDQNQEQAGALQQKLIDLGYEHVSLALDVNAAFRSQNYLEALLHSNKLINLLPADNQLTLDVLNKHVRLLDMFWQIDEARRICDRIISLDQNALGKLREDFPWLMVNSTKYQVIEPSMPLVKIIEAASALGQRFSGNYLLRTLKRLGSKVEGIDAEYIKNAFNYEAIAGRKALRWKAFTENGIHLSRNKAEEMQIILFEDNIERDADTIFALEMCSAGANMNIDLHLILRWQGRGELLDANRKASKALHAYMKDQSLENSANAAFGILKRVIRKAVTKAMASRGW